MGGWLAYILLNLGTSSSGPALVAEGWYSVDYEGAADTPWLIDPDRAVEIN